MCVLCIPVWHNSVRPEIQLWPQRSPVGTNSAPGKQKEKSLISSTTMATCDDVVVLHLYLLSDLLQHDIKNSYCCTTLSIKRSISVATHIEITSSSTTWSVTLIVITKNITSSISRGIRHSVQTFSSRLAMESKVSSEPNSRALFLPFSSSSSSRLLTLFNSSWRSVSSSPMLSWSQTRYSYVDLGSDTHKHVDW